MQGEGWRLPPVTRELQSLLVHRERPDLLGEKAAQTVSVSVSTFPFGSNAVGDKNVHHLSAHREIAPERQHPRCAPCALSCRMRAKRRGRASDNTRGRRRVGRMPQIRAKRDPAPVPHCRTCWCMDARVGAKIFGRAGERGGGLGVASSVG